MGGSCQCVKQMRQTLKRKQTINTGEEEISVGSSVAPCVAGGEPWLQPQPIRAALVPLPGISLEMST